MTRTKVGAPAQHLLGRGLLLGLTRAKSEHDVLAGGEAAFREPGSRELRGCCGKLVARRDRLFGHRYAERREHGEQLVHLVRLALRRQRISQPRGAPGLRAIRDRALAAQRQPPANRAMRLVAIGNDHPVVAFLAQQPCLSQPIQRGADADPPAMAHAAV